MKTIFYVYESLSTLIWVVNNNLKSLSLRFLLISAVFSLFNLSSEEDESEDEGSEGNDGNYEVGVKGGDNVVWKVIGDWSAVIISS